MTVSDYKIEITGVDAYEFTNENGLIVNWQSVIGWGEQQISRLNWTDQSKSIPSICALLMTRNFSISL